MMIWKRALLAALVVAATSTTTFTQAPVLTGRIALLWGDPLEGGVDSQFVVQLFTDAGERWELVFPEGAQPAWPDLRRLNGERVRLTGTPLTTDAARPDSRGQFRVESWSQLPGAETAGIDAAPLFGSQPWVTVRCRFADSTGTTPAVNTSLITGTAYPSMDEYWRETSFNNINVSGSAITDWINLPNPRSYYIQNEVANLSRLSSDCTAAADAVVNYNSFVGINLLFNQSIGGFWWGGAQVYTLDGTSRIWRTTWIGLNPSFPAFISGLAHEMGHGFGLPHSSGPYGATYDSRWDIMSSSYLVYNSTYADYIPQGTISYHKDLDGWIPPARKFTPLRNTSTVITLDRLIAPATPTNYLMAQIPIPGSSRFYTVEFRQRIGHDGPIPGNAVIIHDVLTSRQSPAQVVDATNNNDPNDAGAMWLAGETFVNAAAQISVAVLSIDATTATITVTSGDPSQRVPPGDFDGDGRTDLTVFRPSNQTWYTINSSTGGGTGVVWGLADDVPVMGDYDGDGKADVGVYRPSNGTWLINRSTLGALSVVWGVAHDRPIQADYDGDGRTDIAVYRPSTGVWYVILSTTGAGFSTTWGDSADIPVPADYDGDNEADFAVFRPANGTWYITSSRFGGFTTVLWGEALDQPVPADYDGDGRADVAVYRPSNGTWYALRTTAGVLAMIWGGPRDLPVPGDYDGDGKSDIAVYRQTTGTWFVVRSSTGAADVRQWGNGIDVMVPADYNPGNRDTIGVYRTYTGTWLGVDSVGAMTSVPWGDVNDLPVPGDYDGDDVADRAVYRPSTGTWYVLEADGGFTSHVWGGATDQPVPADYDGDGRTDLAVYRPSDGFWYINASGTGATISQLWGNSADLPVPADYDGDGKADIAVFRRATQTWYILASQTGTLQSVVWGGALDVPAPGDYDGDGTSDVVVFRPSSGTWYARLSGGGAFSVQLGTARDLPAPADYDGDGKTDIAIFRARTGSWVVVYSSTGATATLASPWGVSADLPHLIR